MKNKTKRIIFCIAIIIGILLTGLYVWNAESIQITFGKEYDFEKDYKLYQEYADIYVKTWKLETFEEKLLEKYSGDIPNQRVEITSHVNGEYISITVDGSLSKVVAEYPIEVITEEDESCKINVLYKNGTYENSKKTDTVPECCLMILTFFMVMAIVFYYAIIGIVSAINLIRNFINWIIAKVKKKKYKDIEN